MNDEGFNATQALIIGLIFVFCAVVLLMLCENAEGLQPPQTPRPTLVITPTMYIYLPVVGKSNGAEGTPTPRPTLVGR